MQNAIINLLSVDIASSRGAALHVCACVCALTPLDVTQLLTRPVPLIGNVIRTNCVPQVAKPGVAAHWVERQKAQRENSVNLVAHAQNLPIPSPANAVSNGVRPFLKLAVSFVH